MKHIYQHIMKKYKKIVNIMLINLKHTTVGMYDCGWYHRDIIIFN